MRTQASLLTTAALTAEVAALKQNLEWLQNDRIIMDVPGATTEVATLKRALFEAKNTAAKECTEREKQEARVGEVQQELQTLVKKHETLELDSKT